MNYPFYMIFILEAAFYLFKFGRHTAEGKYKSNQNSLNIYCVSGSSHLQPWVLFNDTIFCFKVEVQVCQITSSMLQN